MAAVVVCLVVGGITTAEPVAPALERLLVGSSGDVGVVVVDDPLPPVPSPSTPPPAVPRGPTDLPEPPEAPRDPLRPMLVRVDGRVVTVLSTDRTVAEVLAAGGISLDPSDRVQPSLDHRPDRACVIVVQRVRFEEEVVEEPVPHDVRERATEALAEGQRQVAQEGADGLLRRSIEITLVDGREQHREVVEEELVRPPEDRIIEVGTAPSPVREAQQLLVGLGFPAGPVDGIDGPLTRRGLCAWRRLSGHEVTRGPLREGELSALRAAPRLPDAPDGRGVLVDRTCQVLAHRDAGAWQAVYAASTGKDGLPRVGRYVIRATRAGWHTSSLYPAPQPNMYNSLYFHGSIAIHGAHHVPPHPASAGCVRVTPEVADALFSALRIGDPVEVVGTY